MSVFEDQALPVLRALSASEDDDIRNGFLVLGPGDRAAASKLGVDLSDAEVHAAILWLIDVQYLEGEVQYTSRRATVTKLRVTGRGQQALGQWPRFELMLTPQTLAAVLDDLADYGATPDQRTNVHKAARIVSGRGAVALKAAAISFGSQWVRHSLGIE